MIKKLILLNVIGIFFVGSSVGTSAFAKDMGLKGACRADMMKFCPEAKNPKDKMECIKAHETELSEGCQKAHAEMKKQFDEMKTACQSDVDKFCSGMKDDPAKLRGCMKTHKEELSPACKAMHQKMREMHPHGAHK